MLHFFPIETNPDLTIKEKIPIMVEWYIETIPALTNEEKFFIMVEW